MNELLASFNAVSINFFEIMLVALIVYIAPSKRIRRIWYGDFFYLKPRLITKVCAVVLPLGFILYAVLYRFLGFQYDIFLFKVVPQSIHSVNDLLLSRAFLNTSAHTIVWFVIFAFFFTVWGHSKQFEKSIVLTVGIVALHEWYWNIFYIVTVLHDKALANGYLGGYFMSSLFLASLIAVNCLYLKKFFVKMALLIIPFQTVYFLYWLSVGFPVTLASITTSTTGIFTQWYYTPFVNGLESLSWYIAVSLAITAYFIVSKYWTEKKRGGFVDLIKNNLETMGNDV